MEFNVRTYRLQNISPQTFWVYCNLWYSTGVTVCRTRTYGEQHTTIHTYIYIYMYVYMYIYRVIEKSYRI
jgi:hypothetical protein